MKRDSHKKTQRYSKTILLNSKVKSGLTTGSTICSQKYLLSHHIGNGTFGDVYIGILAIDDKQNGSHLPKQVAIKVQANDIKASQLPNQIQILKKLRKDPQMITGFPQVYTSGSEGGNHFMVLELLGPNLQDLLILCGGKFTLKTALLLIIQIFQKIEYLHQNGYIYRDIKPQNFVMGIQQKSGQLYIIDFGLCRPYKDLRTGLFIPYKQNVSIVGTIRYASLNSHLGIQQTRRDDLQAIMYMLIYFLKGQLPWQGLRTQDRFEKDHVIMQSKLKISTKQLCEQLPFQIHNAFDYIKSLDFYQDPDYKYILGEIIGLYERMGYIMDLQYDWVVLGKNVQYDKGNIMLELKLVDDQDDDDKRKENKENGEEKEKKNDQKYSEEEIQQQEEPEASQNDESSRISSRESNSNQSEEDQLV